MVFDKGTHAAKPTHADSRPVTRRSTKTDIAKVKTYMAQHYNLPLSIADLAARANISPKYFVDLFKKTYGQSAMEYLTDLRINHAKRYLKESGDKLRDIALKVGYSDEYYFSRKFKKEVGISPSDYARNTKKRIATYSSNMIGQLLALGVIPVAAPIDPKWTAYYYNVYRTEIPSHLKLTDPYTSWRMEANVEKLVHVRPDAIIGSDQISEQDEAKLAEIAPCCVVPKHLIGLAYTIAYDCCFFGTGRAGRTMDQCISSTDARSAGTCTEGNGSGKGNRTSCVWSKPLSLQQSGYTRGISSCATTGYAAGCER